MTVRNTRYFARKKKLRKDSRIYVSYDFLSVAFKKANKSAKQLSKTLKKFKDESNS